MNYLAVWKALEEIAADFRKKDLSVPEKTIDDLKSARITIRILESETNHAETIQKLERYLASIESHLISEGQKAFGDRYVDEWLKRLDRARRSVPEEEKEEARFVQGIPRGQKWIRVKPSSELGIGKLKALVKKSNLSYRLCDDDAILVYGTDGNIRAFVRKATAAQGPRPKK